MPDIFGRSDQVHAGGLSADSMFMTFGSLDFGGAGLLIQNIGLQYQQPVRRIHEIGPGIIPILSAGQFTDGFDTGAWCDTSEVDNNPDLASACSMRSQLTYYVAGRPEGNFSIARIFGPTAVNTAFYRVYGNPCNPTPNTTLSARAGCNGVSNGLQYWHLAGFLITGLSMGVTAQEMVLQEQAAGMFIGLDIETVG